VSEGQHGFSKQRELRSTWF